MRSTLAAAAHAAVQMAAWAVLAGLGRQHQALWAAGLLPLALWLAASAVLQRPAMAAVAQAAARQGPAALALLATSLWWLPRAPDLALPGMALAWAVLGVATQARWRATRPPAAPGGSPGGSPGGVIGAALGAAPGRAFGSAFGSAFGGALGLLAGAGPLLHGSTANWVPPLLLLGALLWLAAAGRSSAARQAAPPPAPAHAAARAAADAAATAPWRAPCVRAASQLAMVSMMATLPWMLDNCSTDQLPAWALLGVHGLLVLLPAGAWCTRRAAGQGPAAAAWLLLAGGVALWWLPGWQGPMLGSLLQAAAWRLTGLTAAGPAAANACAPAPGLGTAACVLAIGLGLAQAGLPAVWLLHSLAAAAAVAVLWPAVLWPAVLRPAALRAAAWPRRAAPWLSPWPAGSAAGRRTRRLRRPSGRPPRA